MSDQHKNPTLRRYFVSGTHCSSCEVLIEKRLEKLDGVSRVQACHSKNEVTFHCQKRCPTPAELNELFKDTDYRFSLEATDSGQSGADWILSILIALIIGGLFFLLNELGAGGWFNIGSASSLAGFWLFGLLAGFSSCAALVGGLLLSLSKSWFELYGQNESLINKLKPHLFFNFGRLISYAILGGFLGLIGEKMKLSVTFGAMVVILVSLLMIFLGLQLVGVKTGRWRIGWPKAFGHYLIGKKIKSKYAPLVIGALTFFLPCGFTITAQGAALLSGQPLTGSLIMLFFALGTLPALILIGYLSVGLMQNNAWNKYFAKTAGLLVIFFALFNINNQMKVINWPPLANNGAKEITAQAAGVQVIKMEASARGYQPNYFKVKAGQKVRWEITDTGTSGCTNAIIARQLFGGSIELIPGQTSVKEFTPTKTGRFRFSCWMGMISGIIEVVE